MATSNGPNLETARRAIERLMDDTCTIVADRIRTSDLDEATGQIVNHDPDDGPVYDGPCMVRYDFLRSTPDAKPDPSVTHRYQVTLPVGSDPVPNGAIITVTSSRRDAQLVGTRMRVESVEAKTFSVSRKIHATGLEPWT